MHARELIRRAPPDEGDVGRQTEGTIIQLMCTRIYSLFVLLRTCGRCDCAVAAASATDFGCPLPDTAGRCRATRFA